MKLRSKTTGEWFPFVEKHFDEFLCDHAACERKASATGVQFVVRYPDRTSLIDPMLRLAREELLHFHQVMRILTKRGLKFEADEKDPYINALLKKMRTGRSENFLDRLLVFSIVERRGTERFGIVAENLKDTELKDFYKNLTEAEARHYELFLNIAYEFFSTKVVDERVDYFLDQEAEIVEQLPLRAAVH